MEALWACLTYNIRVLDPSALETTRSGGDGASVVKRGRMSCSR